MGRTMLMRVMTLVLTCLSGGGANYTSAPKLLSTSSGVPVEYGDLTTLNKNLIRNEYYIDSISNLARSKIPERMWHANGAGAFGYFEVTNDISSICKAKFFNHVGKRTPVAVRFSTVINNYGGSDNIRDGRGFAIKFYTEDGNFDILGLNTPMFILNEPAKFTSFVLSQKRNPVSNVPDPNMSWDFLTLNPETLFLYLLTFGDRGIPDGYRHMPGYSIHTYQLVNAEGEYYFVRFYWTPNAGKKNLLTEEAKRITGEDLDYAKKDLFHAIASGNYPSWNVSVQILTLHDVKYADFDVFDVTRVLPLYKFPLTPLGRLVLDRNPTDAFADVEQLAFSPAHLVPGICGAPDKMFEARLLAYRDAQYYRLGSNYYNIDVNYPLHKIYTYTRDGIAKSGRGKPNYYPNSYNGPEPYYEENKCKLIKIHEKEANNFDQMTDYYKGITEKEKRRTVENILESLKQADKFLQKRAVELFYKIDPDLGYRVEQGLRMK